MKYIDKDKLLGWFAGGLSIFIDGSMLNGNSNLGYILAGAGLGIAGSSIIGMNQDEEYNRFSELRGEFERRERLYKK